MGGSQADAGIGRGISALINLIRDPDESFYREDPMFLRAAKGMCTELGGQMKEGDCEAFKRISVNRTFLWEHTFAPKRQSHVVHDYQVKASWNLHPNDVFPFDAFCLGEPSLRSAWAKYQDDLHRDEEAYNHADHPEMLRYPYPREFFTEYVLRTGALWAGPIKEFELVVRKSSPEQLVSTCFGGLARTSAVEFRASRVNFSPSEDLRILYLPPEEGRVETVRGR